MPGETESKIFVLARLDDDDDDTFMSVPARLDDDDTFIAFWSKF